VDRFTIMIRIAHVSEKQKLEALQWRASLNNPGDREALLANPDAISIPDAQIEGGSVFVAEADDVIVGFAAILPRADGDQELDALFVEPDRQRSGIGRKLVEYCAQAARAQGARELHVVGNPHAEAFYKSCGFQVRGYEQTRFGVGLLMYKPL
jgi:N-acetylglutamate synthase-like GNAT family acetyltransferase